MDVPAPAVPEARLAAAGYERTDDDAETLADLGPARAVGRTLVYEAEQRFFFATRVELDPAPSVGVRLLLSVVCPAAASAFRDDLRERGATEIRALGREACRVHTGERARMRRYRVHIEGAPASALLCCWPHEDTFRVAGGGTREHEGALLELVRAVA